MDLIVGGVIGSYKAYEKVKCLVHHINGQFSGQHCTGNFESIFNDYEQFERDVYPSLPSYTKEFLDSCAMYPDLNRAFTFAYSNLLEKEDIQSLFVMICRYGCHGHVLCSYGKIMWLIEHGVDPNCSEYREKYGVTPLHAAVLDHDGVMVEKLLNKGADPDIATKDSYKTPLMLAAEVGARFCVESLIRGGAKVNLRCKEGQGALHYARSGEYHDNDGRRVEIIERLMGAGAV